MPEARIYSCKSMPTGAHTRSQVPTMSLDKLLSSISAANNGDTKHRLANLPSLHTSLSSFLASPPSPSALQGSSLSSVLLPPLVNLVTSTLSDNNARVTFHSLSLFSLCVLHFPGSLSPYLASLSNSLTAGVYPEAKENVRTRTLEAVTQAFRGLAEHNNLSENTTSAKSKEGSLPLVNLFDGAVRRPFKDKNWRVRRMALQVLEAVVGIDAARVLLYSTGVGVKRGAGGGKSSKSGKASSSSSTASTPIGEALKTAGELLNDRREEVREAAMAAIVACYRGGERTKTKRAIAGTKLQPSIQRELEGRFRQIDEEGNDKNDPNANEEDEVRIMGNKKKFTKFNPPC